MFITYIKVKIIILAFAMLLGTVTHAQESTLPKNVEQNFVKKYPKLEIIDSYEENNLWIVIFQEEDGENTGEAFFTKAGEWQKTFHFQDEATLPEGLKKQLTAKYNDFYYNEVKTTETKTESFFEITIDTDSETFYIKADTTGKILLEKKL